MPNDPEELRRRLAKGREIKKAQREAKLNGAAAETDADESNPLRALATALLEASDQHRDSARLEKDLSGLLEKIDFKRFPSLLESPAVQALLEQVAEQQAAQHTGDLPPGTVLNKGKPNETAVPWTWEHLRKLHEADPQGFPVVDVVSLVTRNVFFNGLPYTFHARRKARVYECFWGILMDSLNMEEQNELHTQWLMRVGPWDPHNPLPPPPNPDWLQDSGARMRAIGEGIYNPGAGTSGMERRELPAEVGAAS